MEAKRHFDWRLQMFVFTVIAVATVIASWVVFSSWIPKGTMIFVATVLFFVASPIGAFWMLYDCAVREKPPFVYFLFALVPYAFVWYYFDRVRPRNARRSLSEATNSADPK
jgi:hypothetical protein